MGKSKEDEERKCTCDCLKRLEALELEVKDLKSWKSQKQCMDDIISSWKTEVETWINNSFGYNINLGGPSSQYSKSSTSPKEASTRITRRGTRPNSKDKPKTTEVIVVQESAKAASTFVDEGDDNDDLHVVAYRKGEDKNQTGVDSAAINSNGVETENVEITPDIFGHFLLDTDPDPEPGQSDGDCEALDDEEIEEEESEEDAPVKTDILIRRSPRCGKRKQGDSSDSEVYTISSAEEDSEEFSTDEEYTPMPKKRILSGKVPLVRSPGKASTSSAAEIAVLKSKEEVTQYITKRPGNTWECNACGFMLSTYENMLLHVKYNHASSTHTCPYCRVVIVCRAPKDAILHQAQCAMRPSSTNGSNSSSKKQSTFKPNILSSAKTKRPDAPLKDVDKFVADLLGPGPSKPKKKSQPAVVTLSSDSDDED